MRARFRLIAFLLALWLLVLPVAAGEIVARPFQGVEYIVRTEEQPRPLKMHIVKIDLAVPGLRFKLTPSGGSRETVRQTTLEFLRQERAQIAINAHFFLPWPSSEPEAFLVGFAASEGKIFSAFEKPEQSYALLPYVPAVNIDPENHVSLVHFDPAFPDGLHIREKVRVWNAVTGSAQIVTEGRVTIPEYAGDERPNGQLTPGGSNNYSSRNSWYEARNARTAIGIPRDGRTLILFTVDVRGGSEGMTPGEVAAMLVRDYGAYVALNLDGGGSTSLAMEDPVTKTTSLVNTSSDNPNGRSVASNLAIFASPVAGKN
jgi:hypothetical protein